jgi:hypothetical protein
MHTCRRPKKVIISKRFFLENIASVIYGWGAHFFFEMDAQA